MKWVTAYSMKDVCIVPDVVLIRAGIGRLLTASLRHSEWSISGQRRILCREELRPATKSTYGSLPADAAASNRYNHYAVPRMAILSFPGKRPRNCGSPKCRGRMVSNEVIGRRRAEAEQAAKRAMENGHHQGTKAKGANDSRG
jgi:hypothetical protein